MPKMRAQIRSDIQIREPGDAHGPDTLYEMPGVRQKVVAEESDKQYKAGKLILILNAKLYAKQMRNDAKFMRNHVERFRIELYNNTRYTGMEASYDLFINI